MDENLVKSITILKDASGTSLYGSRGANGVIVVTTKRPEPGKLRLNYKGDLKIEVPDLTEYNMLDAWSKFNLEEKAQMYNVSNISPEAMVDVQQYRSAVMQNLIEGVDTYWLSKPLRVGIGQNHNLRADGGDEHFRYALSLQYRNVEGVMKGSSRDTFNGGVDLTFYHSNFDFRNNLTIGYNRSENSPYGVFSDYVKLNPYWRAYDDDGKVIKQFTPYNKDFAYSQFGHAEPFTNPLYNATLNTFDRTDYVDITNNFSIVWRLLAGLTLRGAVGITARMYSRDIFKPADHTDFADYSEAPISDCAFLIALIN